MLSRISVAASTRPPNVFTSSKIALARASRASATALDTKCAMPVSIVPWMGTTTTSCVAPRTGAIVRPNPTTTAESQSHRTLLATRLDGPEFLGMSALELFAHDLGHQLAVSDPAQLRHDRFHERALIARRTVSSEARTSARISSGVFCR